MNKFQLWLLNRLTKRALKTYSSRRRLFQMLWLNYTGHFPEDPPIEAKTTLIAYITREFEEEIKLNGRLTDHCSYVSLHNSNPERVRKHGKISC